MTIQNETERNSVLGNCNHGNTNFIDVFSPNCFAEVHKTPQVQQNPENGNMHNEHKPKMAFMSIFLITGFNRKYL